MIKYKYKVTGINMAGNQFESECIDCDLINAAQKYRKLAYSLDSVFKVEQVNPDSEIGICYMKTIE